MNIHEYQAKQLLGEFGVTVPRGKPAFSVDEAVAAAQANWVDPSGWSRPRSMPGGVARRVG